MLNFFVLAAGFLMLVKGADWFVEGASGLAKKLGIAELVVGLTIVAMGTSLPEAAVSITATMKTNAGIAVGNVLGSNILNILIILGITALILNVDIQRSTFLTEIPFMLGITVLLLIFGMTDGGISRMEGGFFLVLFAVYLIYLAHLARKGSQQTALQETQALSGIKCAALVLGGGVLVLAGSNFTVDAATAIARSIGISERIIGLTIVAFGTSLPELVTSVTAAKKGSADIAIGNIVGSNIFNILFVLGIAAAIAGTTFPMAFIVDSLVAIGAGLILWGGTIRHRQLRRPCGIFMLMVYAGYLAYLIR